MDKSDEKSVDSIGNRKFLYVAVCIANLSAFTCGISFGWTSPIIPKLESNIEGTLEASATAEQTSWVGALLPIGAAIGPFAAGFVVDKIGRKSTLLVSIIPVTAAFAMSAYANSVFIFYLARFLCGLSVGGIFTVLPMYVGEISEDNVRGSLGSFMQLFITVGLLFSFSLGPYVEITSFNLLAVVPPLIFFFLMIAYIPETPHFYISKNKMDEAAKSLAQLRGKPEKYIRKELEDIKGSVDEAMAKQGGLGDIFKSPGLKKAFILSIGLVAFQQLSGINPILFYTQTIFTATGSSIKPEIATIIIGAVQVGASLITPAVVDRSGRRVLLISSGIFMGISEAALAYYFYRLDGKYDVESLYWLPVTSLIIYIVFYCLGFGPLPWAVMGELFPPDVKSAASTLTASVCWLLGFIITKSFVSVINIIGKHGAFYTFSGCSFIAAGFVYKLLPETSGKSLQEIQNILAATK